MSESRPITVGVLALQGAFNEHTQCLRAAASILATRSSSTSTSITATPPQEWEFLEVRTVAELQRCDGLIIPGGESTAISLVAERSGMLEALRDYVKKSRKPTWGTCAGLILLAESANRTKKGGQELIGGLDVRVNRNHFGRQVESFQADLDLPFLSEGDAKTANEKPTPFRAVFIRAPIVERLLPSMIGVQTEETARPDTVVAPARDLAMGLDEETIRSAPVEILSTLPGRTSTLPGRAAAVSEEGDAAKDDADAAATAGDIVAVRQANVFGTSFHPELTGDARIHVWWLGEVARSLGVVAQRF